MSVISKIIVIICFFPSLFFASSWKEQRTNAINKWSKYYGIDRALVKAIIDIESQKFVFAKSDDSRQLKKQSWTWDVIKTHNIKTNDQRIWWSIGLMQVGYLVAVDLGYKGSIDALYIPDINIRYGCKRLWQIKQDYRLLRDVIYHYNQSDEYIRCVLKRYWIYSEIERSRNEPVRKSP